MKKSIQNIGGIIRTAVKKDAILTVSMVCAVLSMVLVPPSAAYAGYIDFRVLALLFCLMVVVAGFQECGLFVLLAGKLQNLFLYGRFAVPAAGFFRVLLPLTVLSFLLLTASVFRVPKTSMQVRFDTPVKQRKRQVLPLLFLLLFLLCLLSVFRVLDYRLALAATVICLLLFDRQLFRSADYLLLLTFVCFFIFAGNMGQLEGLKSFMADILNRKPILFSALTSQFISNVPAAVLLSSFTSDWKSLLLGTNIGGLGTPVASLASLISLKFYIKELPDKVSHYLAVFTAVNLLFFLILYAAACFL